jgi:hypothetical protein
MAGTVTTTETTFSTVKRVAFAWTSASSGAADGVTTATFDGKLIQVTTVPDGTAAPTDNYDVEVQDADGVDLLQGNGADRDTANTEHIAEANLGAVAASKLTLAVTNAGDTKKGVVYVYVR